MQSVPKQASHRLDDMYAPSWKPLDQEEWPDEYTEYLAKVLIVGKQS